jgi:hypothetical protein
VVNKRHTLSQQGKHHMPRAVSSGWDPLSEGSDDPDILARATKREIQNILKSYTGYYDLFAELLQNALDAVEKRMLTEGADYEPKVVIRINHTTDIVTVIDNGCGMNAAEFKTFLRPNFSFKDGVSSRGNKGVGATYLAYGFNSLVVATKQPGTDALSGILQNGRKWLDDTKQIVNRPRVSPVTITDPTFINSDCGTLMAGKQRGRDSFIFQVPLRDRMSGARKGARKGNASPFLALLHDPDVKGRAMPDPDRMRQAGWVLCPGRLHCLIEPVPQKILAGFRLDRDEPIHVQGF